MTTPPYFKLWGKRFNPPNSYRVVIVRAATEAEAMQERQRQECTPFDSILNQQLRDGLQPGQVREILSITAEAVVWMDSLQVLVGGELVDAEGLTSLALNGGAPSSAAEARELEEYPYEEHGNPVG